MIKVLEKQVSDKIAAGEVVERPLSVVKELIENAIDSGADSIICEIKQGGKLSIRVTDNGCGISAEEVETAFLRHATSKITTANDLNSLETLGFRGEALASIAAVSRVELLTKTTEEKVGTSLIIHGGETVQKKQTGCPDGTTIIVNDLFYNTPARLKFLKSDGAESNQIIDFMSQIALCYINIKFRLISNGQIVFSTNGKGDRLSTIASIYSNIDIKNLVNIHEENGGISIDGYISTPVMSRPTRNMQIFFVNGRVIESKIIEKGIKKGYKERLFEGRHPITFIFLDIPANTLDVNIHPNKRQVRFDQDDRIVEIVEKSIINALSTKDSVVRMADSVKTKIEEIPTFHFEEKQDEIDIKKLLSTDSDHAIFEEEKIDFQEAAKVSPNCCIELKESFEKPFRFDELNYLGTIFNTYILAQDNNTFYMFDQHACHERINYEKFVNQYNNEVKFKQPIMVPFIVNTSFETNITDNWVSVLDNIGFTLEEFGFNVFRITEIPTFMSIQEAQSFIDDFLDNLKEDIYMANTVVIDKLIMKSCKASIKANDKINMEEIKGLMDQLSKCVNPFSCPHGRPTFVKMTKYEIEKIFKRV